jgi:DNA-binding IclR family transcriptional regulator
MTPPSGSAAASRTARPGVQVIARAAAILRAIGAAPDGLNLAEVTAATDLPKSTAYRILLALEAEQLLEGAGGRYRLGRSLAGGASAGREALRRRARPVLEQLAARAEETVHLGVAVGDSVLFIDQVRWDRELTAGVTIGEPYPLHSCASGKALLAADGDLAHRVLAGPLTAATDNTVTSPAQLDRELAAIRTEGIAYDEEENRAGISGLATYLAIADNSPLSLGIPLPAIRYRERRAELSALLLQARGFLSRIL